MKAKVRRVTNRTQLQVLAWQLRRCFGCARGPSPICKVRRPYVLGGLSKPTAVGSPSTRSVHAFRCFVCASHSLQAWNRTLSWHVRYMTMLFCQVGLRSGAATLRTHNADVIPRIVPISCAGRDSCQFQGSSQQPARGPAKACTCIGDMSTSRLREHGSQRQRGTCQHTR